MIVSAALGGWSDLSFSASGYAWQLVNCAFTAAYSLHLSAVVRAAAAGGMAGPPPSPTAQPGQGKLLGGGKAGAGGPGLAAVDSGGGHSPPPYGGGAHLQSTVVHPASPNKSSGIYYRSHSNGIGNGPGSGSAFGFGPGAAAGAGAGHEGGPPSAAGGSGAGEPAAHPGAPGRKRLSELSMVYYNNVLSVPPLLLLSLAFGEPRRLASYTHFSSPEFGVVVLLGALLGFGVSFASIWCMSRTSATLYSLTGSMNKVVVALVGMWWFAEPATPTNLLSIGLGLAAGFLFVFAKTGGQGNVGQGGLKLAKMSSGGETGGIDEEAGGGGLKGLVGGGKGATVHLVGGGGGGVVAAHGVSLVGAGQELTVRAAGAGGSGSGPGLGGCP